MIRNTALLTLLVFTFTLFAPAFMQPKEAYSHSVADAVGTEYQVAQFIDGMLVIYKLYKVFEEIINKVTHWHNKENGSDCPACEDESCSGASEICSSGWDPPGCGEPNFACESSHKEFITCDNESCKHKGNKYRNCVGHTCEVDLVTSYSGSYW